MIKFHFLNVGHGDCTFVELPSGRLMMVDINNSKALSDKDIAGLAANHNMSLWELRNSVQQFSNKSWEEYYKDKLVDPHDYYVDNFSGKSIFRYIQTHPDLDHMSGLNRFFFQEKVQLWNFWDVAHNKDFNESDFESSPHDYSDWLAYKALRAGVTHEHIAGVDASPLKVLNKHRGYSGDFWTEDSIEILSPTPALLDHTNEKESWNDASYVLKFNHAGRSVILAGDAEQKAWADIAENHDAVALSCDILKAAHHGRQSGYHKEAVDKINPGVVVCSVGKKPETDAHDEYKAHGADVYSTRYNGTITVTIWGDGELWVHNAANERLHTLPAHPEASHAR